MIKEFEIDVDLEIEIVNIRTSGVELKFKLSRKKADGFREDAQKAIFGGLLIKEHDYTLYKGDILKYEGLKAEVKVKTPDE